MELEPLNNHYYVALKPKEQKVGSLYVAGEAKKPVEFATVVAIPPVQDDQCRIAIDDEVLVMINYGQPLEEGKFMIIKKDYIIARKKI